VLVDEGTLHACIQTARILMREAHLRFMISILQRSVSNTARLIRSLQRRSCLA
jgi:hypothetical protein